MTAFEQIVSHTYVDALVTVEKNRRQSEIIGNGVKSADSSMADSMKIDKIADKVVDAVEGKAVLPKPPKPPRR